MSPSDGSRIVVGFDSSPSSRRAVDWAARAAPDLDLALEIVLAWESMEPWLTPRPRDRVEEQIEARAEVVLDEAVEILDPDLTVERVLVQGPAAAVLVERAEKASLLVVGAHGQGGVIPGLGSVASRCAVWSTVPTVVVPAEPAGGERVVVGIDGSAASAGALRVALTLAPADAPLRLVHAWAVPATAAFEVPPIEPSLMEEGGRSILEAALATVPPSDRDRVETELVPGDPRAALSAEAGAASLVVVGSHGHSTVLHRLLGSTVTHLLHEHAAPIVVVPEEAGSWSVEPSARRPGN